MTQSPLRSLFLALLLSTSACGPSIQGAILTPQMVHTNGTHHFSAPKDKVFTAAQGALATLGYRISFADADAGVIKTAPKELATVGQAQGDAYNATITTMTGSRSYGLALKSDDTGTTVVATPKVFVNGQDVSDQPEWVIDGPQGENALWAKLFAEIGSDLGESGADASPPAATGTNQ